MYLALCWKYDFFLHLQMYNNMILLQQLYNEELLIIIAELWIIGIINKQQVIFVDFGYAV